MRKIFNSIDIGTDSIKLLSMEYFNGKYNVLASSCVKTTGLKQGLIIDTNAVTSSIKKCVKLTENKLGTKIDKVLAVVPSHNINFDIVTGHAKVNTEDKKITGEIIFSCLENSIKNSINSAMEIVTMSPIEYKVDNQTKIKNPLGLVGEELAVRVVVGSVPKKNVYSVVNLIESLNIEVIDICFSSVCDYYAIKNFETDSKVVAMVDIGKEKTNIAIFNKGVMIKESILAFGGNSIDEDITFRYKTDLEQSQKIKDEFAVANRKYADSDEVYTCINRLSETVDINQYRLSEIIEAKSVEMLKNIKNEINNLTNREIGYIMITGGITSLLGFNAIVEELFIKNTTVVNLGVIGIRNNKYSSSYGLIKYFVEKLDLRQKKYTMFMDDKIDEMISTRKKIGATGVLSKVFEKIFD